MKIQQYESCCLVIPLELGSKIIAWIELFSFLLFIVLGMASDIATMNGEETFEQVAAKIFTNYLTVVSMILMIVTVLLLVGVYKERLSFIKAWLIVSCFGLVVVLIGFVSKLLKDDYLGAVEFFVGIALYIYFLLVVYSHYRVIKGTAD